MVTERRDSTEKFFQAWIDFAVDLEQDVVLSKRRPVENKHFVKDNLSFGK